MEAKTHSAHTKRLSQFQKQTTVFLAARSKYEAAEARLHSEEEALERVKGNARDITEKLQGKSQQVDSLRTMFAVDERERAAKLAEIDEHSGGCF